MSESFPERPPHNTRKARFAIVASQYNSVFVNAMVAHAKAELAEIYPNAEVAVYEVPGAFEIPVVVQEVSGSPIDAVIALGVIIRGATMHADLIGRAVTDALQQIALKNRTPVIHEVLLVGNEEQARQRCVEEKMNRGTEAARSAARMAEVMNGLQGGD
ncbi:MAG TPA: 6,7-dimethyl-8-ribityllumazine synthase [Chthoniobacteraceae bacterium]|nr:6,7-dimethyl-8-ribityllumazine synthase [Chthoniobacteraceae bacterium]